MIKLSNGSVIYNNGDPRLFIMAGAHGDEKAPVMALELPCFHKIKDVWVLPCLNRRGYAGENRFYNVEGLQQPFDLNREYKAGTKVDFMRELQDVIKKYKPEIFVDMHEYFSENEETSNDFIWSEWENKNQEVELKVTNFCKINKIGVTYQPLTREYKYSGDFFARRVGVLNAYTTETHRYDSIKIRVRRNKMFIKFFISLIN